MKKILFIDDEPEKIEDYIYCLEFQFIDYSTELFSDLDDSLIYLKDNFHNVKIIIHDLMISNSNVELNLNIYSGVTFYKFLKDKYPKIPICILTNVNPSNLVDFIDDVKNNNDLFLSKKDVSPIELCNYINRKL